MFYILDMDFAIEVIQRRHEMDSLNSCLQLGSLEADFVVAYQIGGGFHSETEWHSFNW